MGWLYTRLHCITHYVEDADMDARDISRVKNVITYVEKYVRHNHGNLKMALTHMVSGGL